MKTLATLPLVLPTYIGAEAGILLLGRKGRIVPTGTWMFLIPASFIRKNPFSV